MSIVIALCALVVVFAYEIRYRIVNEHLLQLDNDAHALLLEIKRLNEEIKGLKEQVVKKQDIEPKKGFKFPFFPDLKA